MVTTKEELSFIVEQYMLDNNIDFVSITASMSFDKSEMLIAISEDLEDYED